MIRTMTVHMTQTNERDVLPPSHITTFNVTEMVFHKGKEAVKVTIGDDGKLVITRIESLKSEYAVVARTLLIERKRMETKHNDKDREVLMNENRWYAYQLAEAFEKNDPDFNKVLFLAECGIRS